MKQFTFKTRQGLHIYSYNASSQISNFSLIDETGKVIKFEPGICIKEEYHVRRVMHDFNENCVDIKKENEVIAILKRHGIKSILLIFLFAILLIPFTILYLLTNEANEELDNAGQTKKSNTTV